MSPVPSTTYGSTEATPWQPATQSQYEQWQQQQNGQRRESEQRPDLNVTPAPESSNGQNGTTMYTPPASTDWRPLQSTTQATAPVVPSTIRPIPDPRQSRPVLNGIERPKVNIKPDSLLDRGTIQTASRQFETVPIRWEMAKPTLTTDAETADEGNWRSIAP